MSSWATILRLFDKKYFGDTCRNPTTIEETAKHLATWFYDNTTAGRLRKMLEELPEELWTLVLKNWRDRNHDT